MHNLGDVGNAKGFHHFEILFPKKKAIIVSKSIYMKHNSKSVKSISKKKKTTKKLSKKLSLRKTKSKKRTKRNNRRIVRNITPIRKRKYNI